MDTTFPNKLELHYFFSDKSHSINSSLRNSCEKELLIIFNEILAEFNINAEIQTEAYLEGGFREFWKFLGNNSPQITLILTVITIILSRIPTENKELIELQMENLKLDNEIKRQEIQKFKDDIQKTEEVDSALVEEAVQISSRNYKVAWHKSNFYKRINNHKNIEKISTTPVTNNNEPIEKPRTVYKDNFNKFILKSNKLSPTTDETAIIDIISPVLKKGNFQWRGFYNGEKIGFYVNDQMFRKSVQNKEIEFVNGMAIKCVLHQSRIIDDQGFIKITKRDVLVVLEIIYDHSTYITEQGRKRNVSKSDIPEQTKLDL